MKTWSLWLSSAFAAGLLLLALAAGWRAAPPRVPDTGGWWDGSATRAFESHYDAVFPVRTLGINLWTAIGYALFDEGKPGLVVGRHGWLYTTEEFDAPADAGALVAAHLAQIGEARHRLAQRNSRLVVALLPAKARVYSQYTGERRPAALHTELYPRALAAVRSHGIPAPDLHRALNACSVLGEVFLRTDTHWTPAGARCVAERLAALARTAGLRALGTAAYRTSVAPATTHRGDLLTFLPLEPWFARLAPPADRIEVPRTEPAAGGGLLDEQPQPAIALIGTSYSADPKWNFTGALQQAFGEDVVSYAAAARGPFAPMRDYLDSAEFRAVPPRLVIWEIPERYLPLRDDGPKQEVTP